MKRIALLIAVLVAAAGTASAAAPFTLPIAETIEAPTLRAPGFFDHAAHAQQMQEIHAWLVSEQVVRGLDDVIAIRLTDDELLEVASGVCTGCTQSRALLAGMVKPVEAELDLARPKHGAVERTVDGGVVWTASVASPDAAGLRVHFADFRLPDSYELYLYTMDGEVVGPYTGAGPLGTGEFWSHTVAGPEAVLQLRRYGPPASASRDALLFRITDLGHVAARATPKYLGPADHPLCGFNAECVENAACYSVGAVADAKYAVAHMQYVKRPYIYFCSGGLLNNNSGDQTPYFLTANHCISRDREASTLEAYFQFWTSCNDPECPNYNQIPADARTLGARVVATNRTSDYTLLLLSEPAPTGSAFLGWTSDPVALSHGYELYRISHPQGAPQAYSYHTVDVDKGTCTSWPRGAWIYSYDVVGATEGGSSGSPVVNASGQVVGQLSGGCGTNVYDECDNDSNATVDGALANYFSEVAAWLDPGGCDPIPEICDNGIDDDCDGYVDGADSDCGGSCRSSGESCTSGDECCSGMCHPKKKTCK